MENRHKYLKIAHRGASGYEPDNTIRAFEKAINMGADMIELDVHLCQEKIPVVIHDSKVQGNLIEELTILELEQFDVGKGERIPTLQQAIDCVKGRCKLYIELKGNNTVQPTIDLINKNKMDDEIIIGSFDRRKVRHAKEIAPHILGSILTGEMDIDFVSLAKSAKADIIHFCWERHPFPHILLTNELMETCARSGLQVMIWHEERPEEIRKIIQHNIAGIASNFPDMLI